MSDLVASLVESSGRAELGGIMKTFTELAGTPLIDVQLRCGAQQPADRHVVAATLSAGRIEGGRAAAVGCSGLHARSAWSTVCASSASCCRSRRWK